MSQHQKSKCNVLVVSSTGAAYTTQRGARRLEARGLAERQPDGTLRMIESDHRYNCETPAAAGPRLQVIEHRDQAGCDRRDELGLPNFCPILSERNYGRFRVNAGAVGLERVGGLAA